MRPDTFSARSLRGSPFESKYTEIEFKKHLQEFQIRIGQRTDLLKLVENWEE